MMRRFKLHATTKGALHGVMNATIMIVARMIAIKAIKKNMQAQGLKLAHEQHMIVSTAHKYLDEHPELIVEAAETVRKVPQLRTPYERETDERREMGDEQSDITHSKPNTAATLKSQQG
jgi:hypothetical protein